MGITMQINLETWFCQYIQIENALFGSRFLFLGLQGSYELMKKATSIWWSFLTG